MTITELIKALEELKEKLGSDAEVNVFQYGGGMDHLCDVHPVFDDEYQRHAAGEWALIEQNQGFA